MGCQVLRPVLRSGLAGPGSGSGGSSSSPDEVPCLKSRTPVLNLVRLLPRLHTHTALAPTAPSNTAPRGRRCTPITLGRYTVRTPDFDRYTYAAGGNRKAATACVVVEPSCKRVVSHTTGTAARQGAEAPIPGLRRGKAPRRQYPPNTNKYKGGTLESPRRVRAGTAKGRSPQQTCVGWNRRRVEALGNAPPLRPCETPALMMRKQAAYRRSQHGALRSRSPITIRLTLLPMPVRIEKQQPPASLWNQAVNVLYRTRQGPRRGNKAPRRQHPPYTNKYKGGPEERARNETAF